MDARKIIIAVDGYSSTGKSTFARTAAAKLGYLHLDSGALYRSVTLKGMENGAVSKEGIDAGKLSELLGSLDITFGKTADGEFHTFINGADSESMIRSLEVSSCVSQVAELPFVRGFVDRILQGYGAGKGIVMDGRDIGTTVFPNAELKIFMTADPEVRAMRRMKEMIGKGEDVKFEDVLENVRERDYIDSHRKVSPLAKAPDAVVLDNSHMTPDDQMVWIRDIVSRLPGASD